MPAWWFMKKCSASSLTTAAPPPKISACVRAQGNFWTATEAFYLDRAQLRS